MVVWQQSYFALYKRQRYDSTAEITAILNYWLQKNQLQSHARVQHVLEWSMTSLDRH